MGRLYEWLRRHWVAAGLVAVAWPLVLIGFSTRGSRFDDAVNAWYPEDDPDVVAYNDFLDRFAQSELIIVGIEADNVYTTELLTDLDNLTAALEHAVPEARVQSLARAESVILEGDYISIERLFDDVPTHAEALSALRERVRDDELLSDLVGADERATAILVEIPHITAIDDKIDVVQRVRGACAATVPHRSVYISGTPVVDEGLRTYTIQDLRLFGPLVLSIVVLVIFLAFRSLVLTLVPTLVVVLTMGGTIGVAGLFDVRLNMVTAMIVPLVLVVGVADSIHLLEGVRHRQRLGQASHEALRGAWTALLLPCLITTLTTAAGLLSLTSASIQPLRQFGWLGAVAVGFALLYALITIPVVFSVLPLPPARAEGRRSMSRLLEAMADLSWRRPWLVMSVAGVAIAGTGLGLQRLEIGSDLTRYFPSDDPIMVAGAFIDEQLGGSTSLEVVVEAADVREPAVLRGVEAAEQAARQFSWTESISSPASLVRILHQRYLRGDPAYYRIPDDLRAVAQLLAITEGTSMHRRRFLADYSAGRMTVRVKGSQSREIGEELDAFEAGLGNAVGPDAELSVTGFTRLVASLSRYIQDSQIRSFSAAFIVIALMIGVVFRSLRIGLWALIPNAVPIAMVLGAMGWLGVLLDPATIMLASLLLGIIVDDTVHYLAQYRDHERRGEENAGHQAKVARQALSRAGTVAGRAIVTTSVVLALGIGSLAMSKFTPDRSFGMMCAFGIVVALVCDLMVLPAVIRLLPLRRQPTRSRDA